MLDPYKDVVRSVALGRGRILLSPHHIFRQTIVLRIKNGLEPSVFLKTL